MHEPFLASVTCPRSGGWRISHVILALVSYHAWNCFDLAPNVFIAHPVPVWVGVRRQTDGRDSSLLEEGRVAPAGQMLASCQHLHRFQLFFPAKFSPLNGRIDCAGVPCRGERACPRRTVDPCPSWQARHVIGCGCRGRVGKGLSRRDGFPSVRMLRILFH
jgi:hypothetical protein